MTYLSKLSVAVFYLGYEPALNGDTSTHSIKSLKTKVASISQLLIEQNAIVLGKQLNGKMRPELLSSLEDDKLIPPKPVPPFIPAQPSNNAKYIQLKELLASLEEDRIKAQNGNEKAKYAYRRQTAVVKSAIESLRISLNIAGTSRHRNISNPKRTDK